MKSFYMVFMLLLFVACGNNNKNNTVVLDVSSEPIEDEINTHRTKGVMCANEQYKPTHKLKIVDVATSINRDEYTYGKYDSDAVFIINEDENLSRLFDDRLNCDYLFGDFTNVMSYDEPTLFLGGIVDEGQ